MRPGTVIVTGGVKRLGKAIADYLDSCGWRTIRTSHAPHPLADIVCDLRERNAPEFLIEKAKALLDGDTPFALINNAALYRSPDADIEKVNYLAPKKLTEIFSSFDDGVHSILNILDAAVLEPKGRACAITRTGFEKYAAAKIALMDFTLEAAKIFASKLRVNAIAPGAVLPPEGFHEIAPASPLPRPTPLAVAMAAKFLLEADFTTGAILPVDSGARFTIQQKE